MNAKQMIIAAAVFAASASAFAQQTEFVAPDAGFVSTKSRAEVVAERNQAYGQGMLATQQRDGADAIRFAGTKSRADVVADLNQAYRDGALVSQRHDGEQAIQFAGTRSRDEVRQEALASTQERFGKSGS
ncbi:MAG: DUF4148 domain-containing protein [Burkholderiaceae bacterium]